VTHPYPPATGSTVGLFMELVAVPRREDYGGPAAPDSLPTFTSTGTLNVLALNAAVERAVANVARTVAAS
jgi:hypothetical protein